MAKNITKVPCVDHRQRFDVSCAACWKFTRELAETEEMSLRVMESAKALYTGLIDKAVRDVAADSQRCSFSGCKRVGNVHRIREVPHPADPRPSLPDFKPLDARLCCDHFQDVMDEHCICTLPLES